MTKQADTPLPILQATKGIETILVRNDNTVFSGPYETTTFDNRVCIWDHEIKDYVYVPMQKIKSIKFFPQNKH